MYRWITWPCLIVGVCAAIFGLLMTQRHGLNVYLVAGAALLVFALFYDRRKSREKKEYDELRALERIRELTAKPWPFDRHLVIECRPSLAASGVGFLFLGGLSWQLLDASLRSVPFQRVPFAVGIGMGVILILLACKLFAEAGDRQLVLSSSGIAGLGFGPIPWAAVEGINYTKTTTRSQPCMC